MASRAGTFGRRMRWAATRLPILLAIAVAAARLPSALQTPASSPLLAVVAPNSPVTALVARRPAGPPAQGASWRGGSGADFDWPSCPEKPWRYLIVHHSGTPGGSVESIDAEHRQRTDRDGRPWLGVGYHFVIGNGRGMVDGAVEPTFRWHEQLHGAHAGAAKYNEQGLGICLVGNFEEHPPTERQERSARDLIRTLRQRYAISPSQVLRHKDLKDTACPGKLLPLSVVLGEPGERTSLSRRPARRRSL